MNSKIEKLQRLVADGKHNAFPGLTRFKGALYLSYRSSSGHAMNDGVICLKRSFDDGVTWEDAACSFTDKNYYDGFTVEFKGRLFMYASGYPRDIEHPVWMHAPRAHAAVSEEGSTWSAPREITPALAMCFWHPIVIRERLYVAAYRMFRNYQGYRMEVDLLVSDDGFDWKFVSRISDLPGGNETELGFDGEVLCAFIRNENGTLRIKESSGDFTCWSEEKDFGVGLQGPSLCDINGRRFLSGRFREASPRQNSFLSNRAETKFRTYVYEPEFKIFVEYTDYPSGFDCAYSQSVKLDDQRMLVAYYSQHEYGGDENFRDMEGGSDIYLATVRTDMDSEWGKLTPEALKIFNTIRKEHK